MFQPVAFLGNLGRTTSPFLSFFLSKAELTILSPTRLPRASKKSDSDWTP